MARLDPRLRQIAAGRQPQKPQQLVDPPASKAAKTLPAAGDGRGAMIAGGRTARPGCQRQLAGRGGPNWPDPSARGMLGLNPPSRSNWA